MLRSLKLRIALLTSVITLAIMGGGAAYMLAAIERAMLNTIDGDIKITSITSLPKIFEVRSPRERFSPRERMKPRPIVRGPSPEAELAEGFWISVTSRNNRTLFSTQSTPAVWLERYPKIDPEQNSQLSEDARIPFNRLLSTPNSSRPRPPRREQIPESLAENMEFHTQRFGNTAYRIGFINTPSGIKLHFAMNLTEHLNKVKEIKQSVYSAMPVLILVTISASVFLSSRALSPFRKLSAKIDTVSASGLDARLDISKLPSEFEPLIGSINDMLERLEKSFYQANRFTADASHELRTPLTILKGHLEKLIQSEPESLNQRQEEYVNLLNEVDRLQKLSSQLLFLARSDSGNFEINKQSTAINVEIEQLIEDFRELYPEHSFGLTLSDRIIVDVDWPILQQAIVNLLSNAVNYNNDQGLVDLTVYISKAELSIKISNTGTPVPSPAAELLFERFYRAENARERGNGGGSGLGLSIAKECIDAHGGSITYQGYADTKNTFHIHIPLRA